MTLRSAFRRQELKSAHDIERGVDLRRQRNVHDITEDRWRSQPAFLEAGIAVVNRGTARVPPADLEAAFRQLDKQSSGATGGLKHTADATLGMNIEAILQEFALTAGANSEHQIVILRIVVQCPVNGHREVIRLRKQDPKERDELEMLLEEYCPIKQAAPTGKKAA